MRRFADRKLGAPVDFAAGHGYADFSRTSDDQVCALIDETRQ